MTRKCKWAKMPDKVRSWSFPVFSNYTVTVVSSNDIQKAVKKFEHTRNMDFNQEDGDAAAMHVRVLNKPMAYIFIPHDIGLNEMAHEVYHAVRRLSEYHEIEDDNEFIAYHLGWLLQEISNWRWSWK